ncbi:hypothetical protein AC1031_002355 [Aphanomyces cochlioides]|nr:hypothetical protein AC1031_002355 [Aphanomyces cochlioides]
MLRWCLLLVVIAMFIVRGEDQPVAGPCRECIWYQSRIFTTTTGYDSLWLKPSNLSSFTTKSGDYRLQLQADGNLVLVDVRKNVPIWASMRFCPGLSYNIYAVIQMDGNFVVYCNMRRNVPIWATQTSLQGAGPYCVALSDELPTFGLSVYDGNCKLLWHADARPTIAQAQAMETAYLAFLNSTL